MKKIFLSVLSLFLLTSLFAGADETHVSIGNVSLKKSGENVMVYFDINADNFPSDYKTTLVPVIYNKEGKAQRLRSVTVTGKKRNIYDSRTRQRMEDTRVVTKKTRHNMRYMAMVPYQSWMQTVSLAVEQTGEGCCNIYYHPAEIVADNKLLYYEVVPHFSTKPLEYELTELEKYDLENPFLHPMEDYHKRYDILQKDRDKGTSKVVFKVGSSVIDMDMYDNAKVLESIQKAFELIEKDPNAILKHIMIAGYASPEGALALNTRLGQSRADAVKKYLQQRTLAKQESLYELYNGREDWDGLRDQVEKSSMPEKQEILSIIDAYTIEQEIRKTKLQQLGQPYRYMLDNFYPPLRSGGYVQVYYEIDRRATVATAVTDEYGRTTWIDPDHPRNRGVTAINKAIALMVEGRFVEALDLMEEFKEDPRSWNSIGVCYMMKGDYNTAEEYFRKAVQNGSEEAKENLNELSWARKVEI